MQAAGAGNIEIVRLLLEAGADVNEVDDSNQTALAWAQKRTQDEVAALLKRAGAKDITPVPLNADREQDAPDDKGSDAERSAE